MDRKALSRRQPAVTDGPATNVSWHQLRRMAGGRGAARHGVAAHHCLSGPEKAGQAGEVMFSSDFPCTRRNGSSDRAGEDVNISQVPCLAGMQGGLNQKLILSISSCRNLP